MTRVPNKKQGEKMSSKKYVTITHYKEREFYFLNHAIQTNDGFISKEIEQFHESEKEKLIEKIRLLKQQYPLNQIISISLDATQLVQNKEDPTKASAEIFKNNYVMQEKIDIGNLPVTLYFSPFSILYKEYKHKLDDKLTLIIGLFDRKLYIMFATKDKIEQSWTLGTRGLTEKQVATRVYKSMQTYYKISHKFADHIQMLVPEDAPKLLKVLREELSMSIVLKQKTIHNLLHSMGADQRNFSSSYMKPAGRSIPSQKSDNKEEQAPMANLKDLSLNIEDTQEINQQKEPSFGDKLKSFFKPKAVKKETKIIEKKNNNTLNLSLFTPLLVVFLSGAYFTAQKNSLETKLALTNTQSQIQIQNISLAKTTQNVFDAMGRSGELHSATISDKHIKLKGLVWGIEPLKEKLNSLYARGNFSIKPLENFMTEFTFTANISKV